VVVAVAAVLEAEVPAPETGEPASVSQGEEQTAGVWLRWLGPARRKLAVWRMRAALGPYLGLVPQGHWRVRARPVLRRLWSRSGSAGRGMLPVPVERRPG
jgi:hypothetical protein